MKCIDIASYNKTLNLMRKFTLAALAVFFAVNLSAQNKYTVSGYIRDAATGETLIGAGVMVMSASVAGD